MKCERCGKEFKEYVDACDNCGFDFEEGRIIKKKLNLKYDESLYTNNTDLIDYPILTFILGILSMIIPVYLFSILALILYKKESNSSYIPAKNIGRILAILGIFSSTGLTLFILFTFVF
ncbi:MAG: hypothetical protein WC008_02370 [Bacilli bacterium]